MTAVNLTALATARAKMKVGLLGECCKDQPESHPCRLVWSVDEDCPAFSLEVDDGRVPKATVAGIVAEHNAIGVLIEVVRTLLAYNAARSARDLAVSEWNDSWATHPDHKSRRSNLGDTLSRLQSAKAAHDAALAKVSL